VRSASHLPKLREDTQPPDPSWLPRQRRGTTPQMIGRYPDFDVFDARRDWDPATARVIDQRMQISAGDELHFFTTTEASTVRAFCDLCMAQDGDPRVPVAEMIDRKLAAGELDGYQYDDMPDDRDTWHLVLAGLKEHGFDGAGPEEAEEIVTRFSRGELEGGSWAKLNPKRAWSVCMRMILSTFYAHPWAWNEIGFGGPAYPRGFMRLGPIGVREPWEKPGATDDDPVEEEKAGKI
jgi:hypothetical protein